MLKTAGIAFVAIFSVQAVSAQVSIKNLRTAGMAALKQSVVKHSKVPSAPGCPAAGAEEVSVNFTRQATVSDIEATLAQATIVAGQTVKALSKDGAKCGSCQQLNVVSPASMILPQIDTSVDAQTQKACARYSMVQFDKKFASMEEGQAFIMDSFKQNNPEGEKMFQACPDPCSFYVYVATTNLSGGRKSLNMTVQCGPPKLRQGFLGLNSVYDLSTRVIHEWTCSKSRRSLQ